MSSLDCLQKNNASSALMRVLDDLDLSRNPAWLASVCVGALL